MEPRIRRFGDQAPDDENGWERDNPDPGRDKDPNEPDEAPETPLDEPPPVPVRDPPPDDGPRVPMVTKSA